MKLSIKIKEAKDKPLMREIVDKLNSLLSIDDDPSDFFSFRSNTIIAEGCSNTEMHNKLVIFLAIFVDSHFSECFTSFGQGVHFCSLNNEVQRELFNILGKINSIEDLNYSVE